MRDEQKHRCRRPSEIMTPTFQYGVGATVRCPACSTIQTRTIADHDLEFTSSNKFPKYHKYSTNLPIVISTQRQSLYFCIIICSLHLTRRTAPSCTDIVNQTQIFSRDMECWRSFLGRQPQYQTEEFEHQNRLEAAMSGLELRSLDRPV